MVATNEKVQFDFNEDFGDSNYKSCFARSCVVNSQFHSKSLDLRQLQKLNKNEDKRNIHNSNIIMESDISSVLTNDTVKPTRKDSHVPQLPPVQPPPSPPTDDTASVSLSSRRLSCCSSSSGGGGGGRTSSRRGSDLPVENLALQTQVDTLQWQLKQAEASRQMYRAVMKQVVNFLERAHRSLDLLSERQRVVQRSRSEYHVASAITSSPISSISSSECMQHPNLSTTTAEGYAAFRDFTWRRPKRQQTSPDEVPPEKLSQEAFRLLRTAQSLLNTKEPDLAHINTDLSQKDQEFLSQLAREFPSRPQRATSFSINPQLISPSDRDIRISTAFNRKLSLQRTPVVVTESSRRDSLREIHATKKSIDLVKNLENEFSSLSSTVTSNEVDSAESKRSSVTSIPSVTTMKKNEKSFYESVLNGDKPSSPKTGSVSSAEDESGFSSMNSFQEVGLPVINSTGNNADSPFRNGDISVNSSDSNITQIDMLNTDLKMDKSKLIWNRDDLGLPVNHRRWSSTPVEVVQNDQLKVLWV